MKRSRRYIRITREGWSFTFILAFIVAGSILRQVNLLVMLAGLMIAPLLFNWRISMSMLNLLELRRRLPDWVHAGQSFVVEWMVSNRRAHLNCWGLKITDQIFGRRRGKKPTRVDIIVPQVNARDCGYASYRCYLARRGVYEFGPAKVSTKFPFGLVQAWTIERMQRDLVVAPRAGQLTEKWHRQIQSSSVGVRSVVRRRGTSNDEFYALRPWRTGDSRRWIHWRSTAKHGELIVKQFDQQTDRDFAIIVDLWHEQGKAGTGAETVELAVSFATTVVLGLRQNVKGNVAVALCGAETFVANDRISHEYLGRMMRELALIQPAVETGVHQSVQELARAMPASAPMIVVSTRSQDHPTLTRSTRPDLGKYEWLVAGSDSFIELFTWSQEQDSAAELFGPVRLSAR